MTTLAYILIAALAADDLADILSGGQPANEGLFARFRAWCKSICPVLGKLAECRYCQTFWISCAMVLSWGIAPGVTAVLVLPLAIHRLAQLSGELFDRYLNMPPMAASQQDDWHEIIVNGEKVMANGDEISYSQVVTLAYGRYIDGMTMTYDKSAEEKREGILSNGQTVKIKDGTRFEVMNTGNA
jgi:hypothetical protein